MGGFSLLKRRCLGGERTTLAARTANPTSSNGTVTHAQPSPTHLALVRAEEAPLVLRSHDTGGGGGRSQTPPIPLTLHWYVHRKPFSYCVPMNSRL
jgi:hypothetical protein